MYRFIFVLFVLFLSFFAWAQNAYKVYINEIRAADQGNDDREFIELIGPAGTDITGFRIAHHNGAAINDGEVWSTTIGSFVLPNDAIDINGKQLGFYVLGASHPQLSNVDESTGWTSDRLLDATAGVILYDASNNIIDAVAWGSAGDLTSDDPGTVTTLPPTTANNFLAVTSGDDGGNNSMEAPNDVLGDDGTGWTNTGETPGTLNSGQTGDVSLPVTLSFFGATINKNKVILEWTTESEVNNLGFEVLRSTQNPDNFSLISSYLYNPDLQGQGNTNIRTEYSFTDNSIDENLTYWYKLVDIDFNGNRTEHGPISANHNTNTVSGFSLHQNYPNPFNPNTTIQFEIPPEVENQHVVLSIYNQLGERVVTLFTGMAESGSHLFKWNGKDRFGKRLSSGVYVCALQSGNSISSMKMVLLK